MNATPARSTGALAAFLVFVSGLYFFSHPVADNDLWGHVRFGLQMMELGGLPEVNGYAYTEPHHRWINHEVLAELSFAAVWRAAGGPGLLVFKILLGLLTLAVVARTCGRRSTDPVAVAVAAIAAASLMSFGYLVRPQLFTFLGTALLWDRLHAWHDGDRRGAWAWPLGACLWINTHGGVLAGGFLLALFTGVRAISLRDLGESKRLVALGVACALAFFVNPYGYELVQFLVADVMLDRPISEWRPISVFDLSNLHFKVALLASGVAALLLRERRAWELVAIVALAIMTFRHERHLPLFGIVVAPWLAAAVGSLLRKVVMAPFSRGARVALALGSLAVVGLQVRGVSGYHLALRGNLYVAPELFPVRAVRFLSDNELCGNLALPFDWGEYAIWHLHPCCRVSIDGRYTTAYSLDAVDAALRMQQPGVAGWDDTLGEANLALFPGGHPNALRLATDPDWVALHADPTAVVLARRKALIPERLRPAGPRHESDVWFP